MCIRDSYETCLEGRCIGYCRRFRRVDRVCRGGRQDQYHRELPGGESLDELLNPGNGRYGIVADEITRLQPAEILAPKDLYEEPAIVAAASRSGAHLTPVESDDLEFRSPARQLAEFFEVESLRGFGCEDLSAAQAAAAQALKYLQRNRQDALPHLSGIATYSTSEFMVIDAATRRNLELVRTLRDGSREGSLLALLDRDEQPPELALASEQRRGDRPRR